MILALVYLTALVWLDALGETAVDPLLPPNVVADISAHVTADNSISYVDVTAFAFANLTSRVRKHVSVASIVWGAGNRNNDKCLDEALQLVDTTVATWFVDVILFPETFLWNGTNAESRHGFTVQAMQRKALQHRIYIVVPFMELRSGKRFNSAVLVDRNGSVAGTYSKHFPTKKELGEGITPGSEMPIFTTDFGRIAVLICWDWNFPEMWQAVAAADVDVVFWPAAAKGSANVKDHALTHNLFIASNGEGQFYSPVGTELPVSRVSVSSSSGSVPITHSILDLDQAVVFYGGPREKQQRIATFIREYADKVEIAWQDHTANLMLLQSKSDGVSVRESLRASSIQTHQEEQADARAAVMRARSLQYVFT